MKKIIMVLILLVIVFFLITNFIPPFLNFTCLRQRVPKTTRCLLRAEEHNDAQPNIAENFIKGQSPNSSAHAAVSESLFSYLHLVLFSPDPEYMCMYNISNKYYKKFRNVKTVYYTFSESINNDYELINNILYIKGKESNGPGITEKTIKSFEYFKDLSFDYLIRSNISTIVNFDILNKDLNKKKIDYAGGLLFTLQWIDEKYGIVDKTYWDTVYVSGTSIILSKKAFDILLLYKQHIRYNIIDDVSIGIFFKEHTPIKPQELGFFSINESYKNNTTFYRNKTDNRNSDCTQMKKIIESIVGDR